jgi:diguanylate cyclase (GGDEF)-like protein
MGNSSSLQSIQQVQPSERLVYLVTRDNEFASFISQQINHFGYHVQHVRDIKSLANVTVEHQSVGMLVDIPSSGKELNGKDIFAEIDEFQYISNPLIFISESDDQFVRLKAIRVGGTAYFTKPINIVGLIDKLDSLNPTTTTTAQPNRVLIVDDQQSVASYYQMVLKMSGMDAQFVTNSDDVLNQVREFHPDLILIDTYMPEIRGTDLVRVIRQIDEFVSIPIVFLSSEDDFDRRIEAMDLGGDDFLVKPVKASHLMAVVRSRLERLKTLRSFMVRDSLTNLLNHTAFRSVLTQEVNRCERQETKLALAMLDIDHFKKVNDTYGHSAGDSVLKSLSRLLQQRLRRSDIVGRYGGEEFVALLLDCEAEQALAIMDEIRVHFSEINFYPNETSTLSVTFSCGISTYPEYLNPQDLSDASDQALYRAKAGGRNKVIVARP